MLANVFEMVITILVSVIAIFLCDHICYTSVVLSVVAMSLPGYTLTGAMMELAVKNDLPVPSIWCMPLCIQSFWPLEWGTVIRCGTSPIIHNPPQQQHYLVVMLLLTHDGIFLCLPLDCLVGCLCFGANVQYQFHTYTLNAAVGFVVIYFLTPVVGSTSFFIASSAGAFALGLTGDLYAKMSHHTEFVPLFGGLVMLAPSGIWVRGAVSLFEGESTDNGNGMFTFQVIGIALSITLDFFLANLCVYPTGRK
ncbi:hypothetical protein BC941DRAFT_476957 [Chlamydoabsidia padenii]|nr:hypothetical protein BC941DRAFT_476957 [Chlamydoabsidia padenii]